VESNEREVLKHLIVYVVWVGCECDFGGLPLLVSTAAQTPFPLITYIPPALQYKG
jgi:hypothetical protein